MRGFVVLWQDRLLRTLTLALVAIAAIYLPTESIVLTAYFEELNEPASLGIVISTLSAGATLGAFGYGWLSARLSRRAMLRMTLAGTAEPAHHHPDPAARARRPAGQGVRRADVGVLRRAAARHGRHRLCGGALGRGRNLSRVGAGAGRDLARGGTVTAAAAGVLAAGDAARGGVK